MGKREDCWRGKRARERMTVIERRSAKEARLTVHLAGLFPRGVRPIILLQRLRDDPADQNADRLPQLLTLGVDGFGGLSLRESAMANGDSDSEDFGQRARSARKIRKRLDGGHVIV